MATFNIIASFNGTSQDDADERVSNIVKIHNGLVKDAQQKAFYYNGIGNDKEWTRRITRSISEATGYGGGAIMDSAYHDISNHIDEEIKKGNIKANDHILIDLFGFSRGAALARHFGKEYVLKRLAKKILKKSNTVVNVSLRSESLFDTVPSFGIPINITPLKYLGIRNQEIDLGWDFGVPEGVEFYHVLAIDELRDVMTPKLVDHHENLGNSFQVWMDGVHTNVGGGSDLLPGQEGLPMAEDNALRLIVRQAIKNGLRFTDEFIEKYQIFSETAPLGTVQLKKWDVLPTTQRTMRHIHTLQKDAHQQLLPVTLFETVVDRMRQDPEYRPQNVLKLEQFYVMKRDGTTVLHDKNMVNQLWAQLDPKPVLFSQASQASKQLNKRRFSEVAKLQINMNNAFRNPNSPIQAKKQKIKN